jgi:hypothetical protein
MFLSWPTRIGVVGVIPSIQRVSERKQLTSTFTFFCSSSLYTSSSNQKPARHTNLLIRPSSYEDISALCIFRFDFPYSRPGARSRRLRRFAGMPHSSFGSCWRSRCNAVRASTFQVIFRSGWRRTGLLCGRSFLRLCDRGATACRPGMAFHLCCTLVCKSLQAEASRGGRASRRNFWA